MIDSHTHLDADRFNEDIDEAVARAKAAGVDRFIIPATSDDAQQHLFDTVARYSDCMFATVGLHPTDVNENPDYKEHLQRVAEVAANPPMRLVAIGETGTDLHWGGDFIEQQIEAFDFQVRLSIEHDLPLIIHTRDSWDETFAVLEKYAGKARGVLHSFSGGVEEIERIEKLTGFYYGINGTVTYKNSKLPAALPHIPIDKLVLETDSPFLPPTPYRGQRNESSYVPLIAAKVAEVLGMSVEEVGRIATANTERLFAL